MKKFQASLHKVIICLFVTAGCIIVVTTGACSDGKCSATSRFVIGENMADGHALVRHVFENVTVAGVISCYVTCQSNCRCISFNFLTNVNQDNCQLNGENRHLKPAALMPVKHAQYYDLVTVYSIKTGSSSRSPCTQCTNRCCRNQPCLNGGTCRENCEETGKRFICECPAGFCGQLCQDLPAALGMASGAISDAQISASSEFGVQTAAKQGRLHFTSDTTADGWEPAVKDSNQWLQVDVSNQFTIVTAVATQGRGDFHHRVTKYNLEYSNDTINFQYYKQHGQVEKMDFAGNTDSHTVVHHDLNPPITARYIRFRPVTWNYQIAMRVELYGCPGI